MKLLVATTAALLGCGAEGGPAIDQARYTEALETAPQDPAAAWEACEPIMDPGLLGDCRLAVMERWASRKGAHSEELLARCASLQPQRTAWECAFQVGERRGDPGACAQAGDFADDCRLHLLSRGLRAWVGAEASAAEPVLHERLRAETAAVELPEDDPRAWSAFFRAALDKPRLLSRAPCRVLGVPLQEICLETGRSLYDDRLNRARDRGLYPCEGAELPAMLHIDEDPELEALRAKRHERDLCPPGGQP